MSESVEHEGSIAVVGMAGRFPGAATLAEFWRNLAGGVESITFFSRDEMDLAAIAKDELDSPAYVRARAVLADAGQFDAKFFDVSPREAEITDPQQRLFLECAWEALEDAGCDPSRFGAPIGLFAGAGANGYLLWNLASAGHLVGTARAFQALIHNKNDHLTTRVAYKLGLRGPAVTVQTACSTSLVAVVLACQSLLDHQCDRALAGGVTIPLPQKVGYLYHERGIGSPDGHCRPFDAAAAGTVAGSGAGVVTLARLADALAEGLPIRAILRGFAINNDGSNKIGYTAPSVDGQAEVIARAHALAGVDPASISYVEAHGTATPLGDPMEIAALTRAFRRGTPKSGFCALGAVKSNVGHLDTAAGVAGLIKTVLALGHRQIPPTLHFQAPNPEIDFAATPFFVNGRLSDWDGPSPLRAGVSSFGLGGTNAHVVVEAAPPPPLSGPSRSAQLLVLSARSAAALEAATGRLVERLRGEPEVALADVAYTLSAGRRAFEHRRVVVAGDVLDAVGALSSLSPDRVFSRVQDAAQRQAIFLFPGQGSQYPGMGEGLYREEGVFRSAVDGMLDQLRRKHGIDLRSTLFPGGRGDAEAALRLAQTGLTQPALFIVELALARLLAAWGITPAKMLGHSVGEYVAAVLAEVLSPEDALDLVTVRGRLMQGLPAGAMLAVQLPEHEVAARLGGLSPELEIAAVNGPSAVVVAGPATAVEGLERRLAAEDVPCRRLRTSHAFHSAMMDPIVARFGEEVAKVRRSPPQRPFLSNVSGAWITAAEATDAAYWARHLRAPVRFGAGLERLLEDPEAVLLEVGPGRALRTIARWHPQKKAGQFMLPCLPHAEEGVADVSFLQQTLGQLWLVGIDAPGRFTGEARRLVALPTYPFQRQRHWVDLRASAGGAAAAGGSLDKNPDPGRWFYVPTWRQTAALPRLSAAGESERRATWLLLLDRGGLGARLAASLRRSGRDVVEVTPGRAFRRGGADAFELNVARREDYAALLAELRADGRAPTRIVHLLALDGEAHGPTSALVSPLFLAQAMGGQKLDTKVVLTLVTDGIHDVLGGDLTHPAQALVLGPCKVIPREYPNMHCRAVDLALPQWEAAAERALEGLAADLARDGDAEVVVAYRNGRRWAQSFEPAVLPAPAATELPLRPGGVYLITGGLGGMGLSFAEVIARRAAGARLVLVARSVFPARESWEAELAAAAPGAVLARRIEAIRRIESLGAEVEVRRADVAEPGAIAAVVTETRARCGAIHGVIHAAGVPGGGLIQLKTGDSAAAVLAPKMAGTLALFEALGAEAPDFFVACSSLSTIVGRLGQVDYTAANAFLNAAVRAHAQRTGMLAISIDWGAWEQIGMAARSVEAPRGRALGHPLLERQLEDTPERLVFATDFSVASHWVVDEHRILGNPAVPGVTYFEMVRAALAPRAAGRVTEIADVFFLAPLRIPEEGTQEVRLVLDADGDGFRWVVRSQAPGAARPTEHAMGRARLVARTPVAKVDLDALRRRCDRPEVVSFEVEHEEDLGPRWRSVRGAHLGHGELLLALELPAAFRADFEHLKLHPALLDRASGMAKGSLAEKGYYLPLGYRSLRILGELPPRLLSHARYRENDSPDRETLTFDLTLLGEDGEVLVEIERLTQKRVNDPGSEIRALAAAPVAGLAGGDESREILPHEGAEALLRILASPPGPEVVVSVRDLQASIERSDETVRDRVLDAMGETRAADVRPRPELRTGYVAPRNEIEQKIAEAWQDVLGIDHIGVDDNFFDIGGDSVQAIQIIARGSQLGLKLNPQQFFQYSTIAELAFVLGGELTGQAEVALSSGPVGLSPDQRGLLAAAGVAAASAVRVVVVEMHEAADRERLGHALADLASRHDALRLRFRRGRAGDEQSTVAPEEVPLLERDRVASADGGVGGVVRELAAALRLAEGPLFAAALLRGSLRGDRVVLVVSELVADAFSGPLLAADLAAAYLDGAAGLGAKSASFRQWAERLAAEASSEAMAQMGRTWLAGPWAELGEVRFGEVASGTIATRVVALAPDETRALQHQLATVHRAELREGVAAALVLALGTPRGAVLIDLTGDGREVFEGLDCGRCAGAFSVTAPLLVGLPAGSSPGEAPTPFALLRAVKERWRKLAYFGLPHGVVLRSGGTDGDALARLPQAEVGLCHLGEIAALPPPFAWPGDGPGGAPGTLGGRAVVVESLVTAGKLVLRVHHDEGRVTAAAAEQIGHALVSALRTLATEEVAGTPAFSPADFPLADLDVGQLSALEALLAEADREPT